MLNLSKNTKNPDTIYQGFLYLKSICYHQYFVELTVIAQQGI
ncbi:hypothetical protein SAMN04488508_103214 [Aquimarina spongiae]|uniref:Uncharacterized protein n=1 Tax=Aquimarina spongiae TaxID=570521 RepID=A0A1M6E4K1_9FLAO|nr:hypothetical protein SAMN04488508_103214 [Aquimarina spongiae]